jgi:hypothetical protein
MSICVISQRNHNYTEQIRRLKKISVCEGKTFAHRPMHICVSVYFLKKSQPEFPFLQILPMMPNTVSDETLADSANSCRSLEKLLISP